MNVGRNIATLILPPPKFDLEKTGIISKKAIEKREINKTRRVSEEELIDENGQAYVFNVITNKFEQVDTIE